MDLWKRILKEYIVILYFLYLNKKLIMMSPESWELRWRVIFTWLFCQQRSNSKLQLDGGTEARWDSPNISCCLFLLTGMCPTHLFFTPQIIGSRKFKILQILGFYGTLEQFIGADQNRLYILSHGITPAKISFQWW